MAKQLLPRAAAALSFDEGYTQLLGDSNLMLHRDDKRVHISLHERTGAGFASQDMYLHGFFNASIKLPSDYAAGVVVAFYLGDGRDVERGRVREDARRADYAILWSRDSIVFYIDGTLIREVVRSESMGAQFPSKSMSLYATIWDGSSWATSGGQYKVNYKYAPYVAEFTDLVLRGCAVGPATGRAAACEPDSAMSSGQRSAMERFRARHMTYGYCYDRVRYPAPLPECSVGAEVETFLPSGEARATDRRRQSKRHRRRGVDSAL